MKRFKPSRAGVINIWDYTDEEFVFADGRLVLRGHNGSGKTKALEVLFPFVLDGVVDARRLDPFSGENRTMKSNLLYRGQESEYGFVWMEFAADDRTVTLIVALRAHKDQPKVTTSFFVTARRLGIDFGLLSAESRPLTERQLKQVLEPGASCDSATEYRDAIDVALFGLGRQRYTQLIDLLLALRRPLLAKDLDPGKVSDTLTAGLSPVADDLVEQAARDFENLSAVQRLVDDLMATDAAAGDFLTGYAHYLQVHARHGLDRIQAGIGQAAKHAAAIGAARTEIDRARAAQRAAEEAREAAGTRKATLSARLDGLKSHEAYVAQGDLERLRAEVVSGERQTSLERATVDRAADHLALLAREAEKVGGRLADAQAEIARQSAAMAESAGRAGIAVPDGADDPLAARAQATARTEDVEDVRVRLGKVAVAEADRSRADDTLQRADGKVVDGEAACAAAVEALDESRRQAADRLRAWAGRWSSGAGDSVVSGAEVLVLTESLARVGDTGAPGLGEVFRDLCDGRRTRLVTDAARLEDRQVELGGEIERLVGERDEIADERDDAPPLPVTRLADRAGRAGGPLWRLVRFADGVPDDVAAAVEGALDAAGMLTSWIHPDAGATEAAIGQAVADAYLLPLPAGRRPVGATLSAVLVPEDQDLVSAEVISGVLDSIALSGELGESDGFGAAAASRLGQFSYGVHLGALPKAAPEYVGATHRAARRRARIAECDKEIDARTVQLAQVGAARDECTHRLADIGRAKDELPTVKSILAAVAALAGTSTLLAAARAERTSAMTGLDTATAEVDAERRRLRQVAAERNISADPAEVDAVARAIGEFTEAAGNLVQQVASVDIVKTDLDGRRRTIEHLAKEHSAAAENLLAKQAAHLAMAERLATLEATLGAPLREILAQITDAERSHDEAHGEWQEADQRVQAEHDALVEATYADKNGHGSLVDSMGDLLERFTPFGPLADLALRPVLGITAGPLWPDRSQWPEPEKAAVAVIERLSGGEPATAGIKRLSGDEQVITVTERSGGEPVTTVIERSGDETDTAVIGLRSEGEPVTTVTERMSGSEPVTAVESVLSVLPDGVTAVLDLYDAATSGKAAGETARKNAGDRMSEALKEFNDALTACEEDYRLDWEPGDSVVTVHVLDVDGRHPVAEFARRTADRAEEQRFLLAERERTVLEDELLADLAQQIFDRVFVARDLVKGMDSDTRGRPMSTGTTVGIRWVVSGKITDSQREVAELLGQDGLGPEQLADLRRLLRQMIREYRAGHPRAAYREVLSTVLDYRTWRSFELRLKVPGEAEVTLSKKRHSQMSGGEKSAAIHLPLFAAANALYTSAFPTCPRMVALDEAFAGIDDLYKPDLLGLTVQYDLDVFMTGHDLWVRYETVPAAAHYDMHSDKVSHTVSAMLILWDGIELIDSGAGFAGNEELAAELLGFAPTRRAPAEAGLLVLDPPAGTDE